LRHLKRRLHNAVPIVLFSEEPTQQEDDITDIDLYGDLHLDIAQQISYDEVHS
jgi:hypothetical protein